MHQQTLARPEYHALSPWEATRDMYVRAVVDKRLSHASLRLLVLLTEYSFWRVHGGNSRGSIRARNLWLRKELGASKNCIGRWSQELVAAGYVWIQKVHSGKDTRFASNVFHLTCLVAKGQVPDLIDNIVPMDRDDTSPPMGTTRPHPEGRHAPTQRDDTSPPMGSIKTRGTGRTGGGQEPPPSLADWKNTLKGLFPRELEAKLERVNSAIKTLKADARNYEQKLKPELADFIAFAESQIASGVRVEEYRQKIEHLRKDSNSFARGDLKPEAKSELETLNLKKQAITEKLT